MYTTVPQLMAAAIRGRDKLDVGDERCFYCGAACDRSRPATTRATKDTPAVIKSSFTDWPNVANPSGEYVCVGCMIAAEEKAPLAGYDKLQKRRNFSWFLTPTEASHLTKRDVLTLRSLCLDPPDPPFAIVLADSGQKQLLYRARVNHQVPPVTVQLETESITFEPDALRARIEQVESLIGSIGKSKLLQTYVSIGQLWRLAEQYDDAGERLDAWHRVYGQPLSRLAVFLTPSPKEKT